MTRIVQKVLVQIGIFMVVGSISATALVAKDCNCKKHSAGASGSGSCTLTETSSRCSINYTGSASSAAMSASFTPRRMEELAADTFRSKIPIRETFRFLNRNNFQSIREDQFRSVFINSVMLLSRSEDEAERVLSAAEIRPNSGFEDSGILSNLFRQFSARGCAESNLDAVTSDTLRYLIIHSQSEFSGSCTR